MRFARSHPAVATVLVLMLIVAHGVVRGWIFGYPSTYRAEAVGGSVIDAQTQQPIAGVIMIAHWQLEYPFAHVAPRGEMMVLETVSDDQGNFQFPAWGQKLRPWGWARIGSKNPQILLFKPGYKPSFVMDEATLHPDLGSVRRSQWNGKAIELEARPADDERYADLLHMLAHLLGDAVFEFGTCDWRSTPRMLAAIEREHRVLPKNVRNLVSLSDFETMAKPAKCGSLPDFIEEHLR